MVARRSSRFVRQRRKRLLRSARKLGEVRTLLTDHWRLSCGTEYRSENYGSQNKTEQNKTMKLRFNINQAEAFRRGIDHSSSTAIIEVDPSKLTQESRDLIADRLDGIDVCELRITDAGKRVPSWNGFEEAPNRLRAALPTYDALLEAVIADEAKIIAEHPAQKIGETLAKAKSGQGHVSLI
jgi:hypothetical protein